ncbi:MAG: prephenate dehydratase [Acidimicrobiales bacterium]
MTSTAASASPAAPHGDSLPVPRRVAFLGPLGTFTEEALLTQPDLAAAELVPMPSMLDVLHAVHNGEADVGFAAIENALEGSVSVTADTLAFDVDLLIEREVVLPVRMQLLGVPGAAVDGVREIVSIPIAAAQCRRFIHDRLGGSVRFRDVDSTAEAARVAAEAGDPTVAAVANSLAATKYGLAILATNIEDHPDNATRFLALRRNLVPAPSGHDKTTLVVFQHADRPGSLLAILQEFAARSINLTWLESRPTKRGLGDYCFLLDFEGHIEDEVVGDCLRSLKAEQADVKFLGSYPAFGDGGAAVRADVTASFRQADEWLAGLRTNIVGR